MKDAGKLRRERFLKYVMLLIFGIVIPVLLIEILMRLYFDRLPISFVKYLPTDVRILAQRSKDELVPEMYIALLGDSYAAGWGDWYLSMLESNPFDNPRFHSAHVIHDIAGIDVLSFAQPGFGSFDALAYYPIRYVRMLQKRGYDLPAPRKIIVYFYEGNDFKDNATFLETYWKDKPDLVTK